MASFGSPKIDPRSVADMAAQTRALLRTYLSGPPYRWPADADGGEVGRALTGIFAHYCGLVVDRLNRAPEKNFLAFLDLLGNARIPAEPARTTVTLALEATVTNGYLLPAGTRFQADPPPGASDPMFFESEREVWLAPVDLVAVRRDGKDLTALVNGPDALQELVFSAPPAPATTLSRYLFCLAGRPGQRPPAQSPVEMYFWLDSPKYDPDVWAARAVTPDALVWQWSSDGSSGWQRLLVEDETAAMTRSGAVRFLAPLESAWHTITRPQGDIKQFWVRVAPPAQRYVPAPVWRCVAVNTVAAVQAITVTDEVLGSSSGKAAQAFNTLHKPVLEHPRLEVFDAAAPRDRGGSSGTVGAWVVWIEVPDFHDSGPLDRHYVLDHDNGKVRFGDGVRGAIPPRGARNVRLAAYRSGGGTAGNVPAGAIRGLTGGARQIKSVTNLFAASGGSAAETDQAMLERGPRKLRHRDRAVTQEDYEDLAQLSTTEVARSLCVPLQDLRAEPYKQIDTEDDEKAGVGKVSVIVVPRTDDPKPLPAPALLETVQAYLAARASPGILIAVVGPLYVAVNVDVSVRLRSVIWRDAVEGELQRRLARYLHPLTGSSGDGWPFGRRPYESDVYATIGDVPGVAYLGPLRITLTADNPSKLTEILATRRFLIHSGTHTVTFV